MNVVVIGIAVDVALRLLPEVTSMPARLAMLGASPLVLGLGSGLYIGAGLGPGPRDGLMTALSRRGLKTWQARTLVETSALTIGFLLGGKVFWGTLWMALAIGPCVQLFLQPLTIDTVE